MLGRHREEGAGHREVVRSSPGGDVKVHLDGELFANLIEGVVGPVSEPVEDTSVEQGRRCCSPVLETIRAWIHCEDHVEVLHDLVGEPLVELLVAV